MTCTLENSNETLVIAAAELNELVRGNDESLLNQAAPLVRQSSVSLDLARVERIDAAGIAALISLYGSAREAGNCFHILNASARVAEILALVGLDKILLSRNAVRKSLAGSAFDPSKV